MQNSNPLISVIINCYNGEKYLREAIDSVINQTYQNWEIIFWDNQSTDSSKQIVTSYKDNRIHYFCAPTHTSLGEARNLAVEKANGEQTGGSDKKRKTSGRFHQGTVWKKQTAPVFERASIGSNGIRPNPECPAQKENCQPVYAGRTGRDS